MPFTISVLAGKYSSVFLRLRWTHVYAADQSSLRHTDKVENHFCHIFRRDLPIRAAAATAEIGVHAARHDVADADILISEVLHDCFAKSIQAEFGRVVSRSAGECIYTSKAADLD